MLNIEAANINVVETCQSAKHFVLFIKWHFTETF